LWTGTYNESNKVGLSPEREEHTTVCASHQGQARRGPSEQAVFFSSGEKPKLFLGAALKSLEMAKQGFTSALPLA
jgi:hypothetical protein